jgi:hypothetical protein
MKNLLRQVGKFIMVVSVLGLGLAAGAAAQEPYGGHGAAPAPGQSVKDKSHKERTTFMRTAMNSPEVKMPRLDAAVPAHTETASFGLG